VQDDGTLTGIQYEIEIVRGDNPGVLKGAKQVYELPPGPGIKIGRGLVHDQDIRFHG